MKKKLKKKDHKKKRQVKIKEEREWIQDIKG